MTKRRSPSRGDDGGVAAAETNTSTALRRGAVASGAVAVNDAARKVVSPPADQVVPRAASSEWKSPLERENKRRRAERSQPAPARSPPGAAILPSALEHLCEVAGEALDPLSMLSATASAMRD